MKIKLGITCFVTKKDNSRIALKELIYCIFCGRQLISAKQFTGKKCLFCEAKYKGYEGG